MRKIIWKVPGSDRIHTIPDGAVVQVENDDEYVSVRFNGIGKISVCDSRGKTNSSSLTYSYDWVYSSWPWELFEKFGL